MGKESKSKNLGKQIKEIQKAQDLGTVTMLKTYAPTKPTVGHSPRHRALVLPPNRPTPGPHNDEHESKRNEAETHRETQQSVSDKQPPPKESPQQRSSGQQPTSPLGEQTRRDASNQHRAGSTNTSHRFSWRGESHGERRIASRDTDGLAYTRQ